MYPLHTSLLNGRAGECTSRGRAHFSLRSALEAQRATCADGVHVVVYTIICIRGRCRPLGCCHPLQSRSCPLGLGAQALPRRSPDDWYSQSSSTKRPTGGYIQHQQACRSHNSRRGLWPASNKPSANVAPSASSSNNNRLATMLPPRCNTLHCRPATLCRPRASAQVRLLSRTVR